ncbi:MAG: hypothetical protein O7I93_16175 [Gemmatimonadetes bacterium]|nr:hypothetical protein [Gemmatimonadota bacterium]
MHIRQCASITTGLLMLAVTAAHAQTNDPTLKGVWSAERYVLREGPTHEVAGRIFFTEREWTVLFFVIGDDGEPRRGSAEGGTYTLRNERLVFSHLFHLSRGDEMPGLAASPLRMTVTPAAEAATEPSTIEVLGNRLTIFFPSGNSLEFRRVE